MSSRRSYFFLSSLLAIMFVAGYALAFTVDYSRSRHAGGTLAVGSEIVVSYPTGEVVGREGDRRPVMRTVNLRVFRVGDERGEKPAGDPWTFRIGGVGYAAVPVE